jgi:membrane protease YdiL (CAAX protease family)
MANSSMETRFVRLRVIGRAILFMIVCAIILAGVSPWIPKLDGMRTEFFLGLVTAIGSLFATLLFVHWERIPAKDLGVVPDRRSGLRLLCGFLIGLIVVGTWALASAATGYVRWARGPGTGASAAILALVAYLALACREELAFHGYPLRRLQHPLGVWGAQITVAMMFALEHRIGGYDWLHAIFGAGVGSLLFGMAAIVTRGLAVPIGIHSAWNLGQWMLGVRGHPAIWQAVIEENHSNETEIAMVTIYVLVMTAATCVFWCWYRHTNTESER